MRRHAEYSGKKQRRTNGWTLARKQLSVLERLDRRVSRQLGKGHEAGPVWHERNGGGDGMYPATSRERTAWELKGLLRERGFYEMPEDRV